jgi:hypothetical protein
MTEEIWNNRDRARQLISFKGLEHGTALASDIDGFIEWRGLGYIFIEVKYGEKELPLGQRLAYERVARDLRKPAIVIVSYHHINDVETDIEVADCAVREIFYNREGKWREPKNVFVTTKEIVDNFIKMIGG